MAILREMADRARKFSRYCRGKQLFTFNGVKRQVFREFAIRATNRHRKLAFYTQQHEDYMERANARRKRVAERDYDIVGVTFADCEDSIIWHTGEWSDHRRAQRAKRKVRARRKRRKGWA